MEDLLSSMGFRNVVLSQTSDSLDFFYLGSFFYEPIEKVQ